MLGVLVAIAVVVLAATLWVAVAWSRRRWIHPDAGSPTLLDDLARERGPNWELLARKAKPRPVDELVAPSWLRDPGDAEVSDLGEPAGSGSPPAVAVRSPAAPERGISDTLTDPIPPSVVGIENVDLPGRRQQALINLGLLDDLDRRVQSSRLAVLRSVEGAGLDIARRQDMVQLADGTIVVAGTTSVWRAEPANRIAPAHLQPRLVVDVPVGHHSVGDADLPLRAAVVITESGEIRSVSVREADAADVDREPVEHWAAEFAADPTPEPRLPGVQLRPADLDFDQERHLGRLAIAVAAALAIRFAVTALRPGGALLEDYADSARRWVDETRPAVRGPQMGGSPTAAVGAPKPPASSASWTAPSPSAPPTAPIPAQGAVASSQTRSITTAARATRAFPSPAERARADAEAAELRKAALEPEESLTPRRRPPAEEIDEFESTGRRVDEERVIGDGPVAVGPFSVEVDGRAEPRRKRGRELEEEQRVAHRRQEKERDGREVGL